MSFLDAIRHSEQRALSAEEIEQINNPGLGLDALLGLRYDSASKTQVRAHLEVNSSHLQFSGQVNGGVFSAIAESVGSVASVLNSQHACVGINNSTDFIRAVSTGIIEAVGTPIQTGRRTQLWSIEMFNNDRLAARTTLRTMVLTDQPISALLDK